MENLLKLIIADDEQYICGMLQKLIRFEELNLSLATMVNDGESLLRQVEELKPDIVVTDICMPKLDGLEVIRMAREKGITSRFVIISGFRRFEYAYNALKYDVSDYILKPVEAKELNTILAKICTDIRKSTSKEIENNRSAIRTYVIEKAVENEFKNRSLTMEEINQSYRINFKSGLYRVAFLKLDFEREGKQELDDISSIVKKMRNMVSSQFEDLCYEVVMSDKREGVMFLLNYDDAKDVLIKQEMCTLFTKAKNVADMFQGFNLTLCVGKVVSNLYEIDESKQTCRHADWMRMALGLCKVIFSEDLDHRGIGNFDGNIKVIEERMGKAFVALDTVMTKQCLEELFSMPIQVVGSYEFMITVRKWLIQFSDNCEKLTKQAEVSDKVFHRIVRGLHSKSTFQEYEEEIITKICSIMEEITEDIQGKSTKPIREACAYIEQHYNERLSLEEVAGVINLSPVYFCNLFKKSTGQNYTEYLTDVKIKKAKEFLKGSNMNINEIADKLGFTDARYFSKLFKKEIGVKPTDYRKIYG